MHINPTQVKTEWLTIPISEEPQSAAMECYLAQPAQEGQWPAIIVFMEIFGINHHIRNVVERLAAEGYVAIAPNYYHRTTRNLELSYTSRDVITGRRHKEQTTRSHLLADVQATLRYLRTLPTVLPHAPVGCIGFCFGGHVAYIAAGLPQIAATVCFYPGGVATTSPGEPDSRPTIAHSASIHGEVLCLFGEDDPLISHEDTVAIEHALRDARVPHEVIRYSNTGHGFFCNERADFDPSAAEDAWLRVKSFFARTLHTHAPQAEGTHLPR